ncbi:phospholipase D-like domain-containing protein [Bradyrhizobium sp. USDA 3364]
MKAVAFSNNDMAVVAWTFGGKLTGCLGFAVHRIDVKAGTETVLPAMATFKGEQATVGRTTADDPVQKFFWKDVYAARGGTYKYKIVPMTGTPGKLTPMPFGPLVSNQVQLSPNYGTLSAYFNRGILATQATAHTLSDGSPAGSALDVLKQRIVRIGDQLRVDLAGDMIKALTTLPDEALSSNGELLLALYEFQDPELIQHFAALRGRGSLILSNMPGGTKKAGNLTNDTYSEQRQQIKAAGLSVIDRFMPSNSIGHNKFQVLIKGTPQAVLLGSTNCTSNALCAQTNNTIIARSPAMAQAYADYWQRLKQDTVPPGNNGKAQQGTPLRSADGTKLSTITLEDNSGTVDLWFSPNTPHRRASKPGPNEATPPDMQMVFDAIAGAKQAIVFLAFEPGSPSIVGAIADALKAKPSLFVRGAVTALAASGDFAVGITGGAGTKPAKRQKGDPPLPEDYRVIHTRGVTKSDAFGQWEAELNQAGHAVIHDKIVVVDPFADDCVVITGSHNLGYKASYNNDENMAIIRGHRAVAEAYAAHCLDVYDHYAWRYWLQTSPNTAWHFLATDDSWQNGYFSADNQVKSAELSFWLAASPASEALPTPVDQTSTRARPGIQAAVGGVAPAIGPHARAPGRKGDSAKRGTTAGQPRAAAAARKATKTRKSISKSAKAKSARAKSARAKSAKAKTTKASKAGKRRVTARPAKRAKTKRAKKATR